MEKSTDSAILYTVRRIAGDPAVYWHFLGTESWARLIDAYAAITGQDPAELHRDLAPAEDDYAAQCETESRRARLDEGSEPLCVSCQARQEYDPEISEQAFRNAAIPHLPVLDAWERLPDYDRRQLLTDLAAAAY